MNADAFSKLADLLAMVVILGSGIALVYCVRDVVLALIGKLLLLKRPHYVVALIRRLYAIYKDRG